MKHEELEGKPLPCIAYMAGFGDEPPRKICILQYNLAAPGCTIKSVVGKYLGSSVQEPHFRTSVDNVFLTEEPLWQEMLSDFQGTIDCCNSTIANNERLREETKEKLEALKNFLSELQK